MPRSRADDVCELVSFIAHQGLIVPGSIDDVAKKIIQLVHAHRPKRTQPLRVMGFRDLVLFYVVTGVSLRWIAAAASIGPGSLSCGWQHGCFFTFRWRSR